MELQEIRKQIPAANAHDAGALRNAAREAAQAARARLQELRSERGASLLDAPEKKIRELEQAIRDEELNLDRWNTLLPELEERVARLTKEEAEKALAAEIEALEAEVQQQLAADREYEKLAEQMAAILRRRGDLAKRVDIMNQRLASERDPRKVQKLSEFYAPEGGPAIEKLAVLPKLRKRFGAEQFHWNRGPA